MRHLRNPHGERVPDQDRVRKRRLGAFRLVREKSFLAPEGYATEKLVCDDPVIIFRMMKPYVEREEVECLWVIPLDARNQTILRDPIVVGIGILNSALVHPREVFRPAIAKGAHSIVLVHNHPSGDPSPSTEDRLITSQLLQAGKAIGIDVLDHIIVCEERYLSFAERGLLV